MNKPYSSTLALYLALECSLSEHSSASVHLQRANARSAHLVWHSRVVSELVHLQCVNARLTHLVWYSRAVSEHLRFFPKCSLTVRECYTIKDKIDVGFLFISAVSLT